MKRAIASGAILLALAGAGVLVWKGQMDRQVDLSSAGELWSDVLRDADQLGWHAARVSDTEEIAFGDRLWAAMSVAEDPVLTLYITEAGRALEPQVRRKGIPYRFHAVESPMVNAFALPGGHVVVGRGMIDFVQSEAELESVLAHEVAHIDLRHCIGAWQYRLAARRLKIGDAGAIADLARMPVTAAYRKYEESEADLYGVRLIVQSGYDPGAAIRLQERFGARMPQAPAKPVTPVAEVTSSVWQALGSYLDTHPNPRERARRLNAFLQSNRGRLAGKHYYQGRENLRRRVPKTESTYPGEWVKL